MFDRGKRQSNGKSKLLDFTFLSFPQHICMCISILASPHNPKLEPDFIQQTINGNKRTGTCTKLGTVNLRKKIEQKQTDKGLGH